MGGGGWSSSAAWLDFDRDGRLDLFVARYVDYDLAKAPYCGYRKEGYRMYCDPQQFDGTPNLLYHNNGDGTFTDVSKKAGVANPAGKGLGVAVGRYRRGRLAGHFRRQRWRPQFPVPQSG